MKYLIVDYAVTQISIQPTEIMITEEGVTRQISIHRRIDHIIEPIMVVANAKPSSVMQRMINDRIPKYTIGTFRVEVIHGKRNSCSIAETVLWMITKTLWCYLTSKIIQVTQILAMTIIYIIMAVISKMLIIMIMITWMDKKRCQTYE